MQIQKILGTKPIFKSSFIVKQNYCKRNSLILKDID